MRLLIFLFLIVFSNTIFSQTIEEYKFLYKKEKNKSKKAYYAALLLMSNDLDTDGKLHKEIELAEKRDKTGKLIFDMFEISQAVVNNDIVPSAFKIIKVKNGLKKIGYSEIGDYLEVCAAYSLAENEKYAEASVKYEELYPIIEKKIRLSPTDFICNETYVLVTLSLGFHYFEVGEEQKSIFYLEKLIKEIAKSNNKQQFGLVLINVATCYSSIKKFDKALEYYDEALIISKEFKSQSDQNWIHSCKAKIFVKLKQYKKAKDEISKIGFTFENGKKIYNDIGTYYIYLLNAQIFFGEQKYSESEAIIDDLLTKNVENELNSTYMESIYELKYKLLKQRNDFSGALKYFEIWNQKRQKNNEEKSENNRAIQQNFMSFEQDRLKETINTKAENKITNLRLRNQFIIISILFVITIIFLFFLFRFYKLNKKLRASSQENKLFIEKIEESLSEKEVMLKEIHHRVKNNFQIISSLLNIQSSELDDEKYLNPLALARNRVYSMSLVHQKLYSFDSNYRAINFQEYLPELLDSLRSNFGVDPEKLQVNFQIPMLLIPLEKAVTLGLLCNEVFTNCFKYATGTNGILKLSIESIMLDEKNVQLVIRDFGPGFSGEPHKKSSIGHQLKAILTQQLEGTIENYNENGAVVKITFPL